MRHDRVARCALVLWAAGCAATIPASRQADARVSLRPASTEDDPAPFTPRPDTTSALPQTTSTVALTDHTGTTQARALAARLVRALLDADANALRDVFAEEVTRLSANQRVARDRIVSECLGIGQQLHFHPEQRVEDAIGLAELQVAPLLRVTPSLAQGLSESDVAVDIPVRRIDSLQASELRYYTDLPCISRIVVRPGPYPTVVGVGR